MNIVILDDEAIICEGLSAMLAAHGGRQWNLFATYHDAEEALGDWDKIDCDSRIMRAHRVELLTTSRTGLRLSIIIRRYSTSQTGQV